MNQEINKHRYSSIYNELVDKPNNLVGLLAYSIYKQEKIDYVKHFEEDKGRPPEPSELKEFHHQAHLRIAQYNEIAESRVSDLFDSLFKTQSEMLEEEYNKRLVQELKSFKPSWWAGVFQGVMGSILYSIFIGLIIFYLLYAQYGVGWLIQYGLKQLAPSGG